MTTNFPNAQRSPELSAALLAESFRRMQIQTAALQIDPEKRMIFNFVMNELPPDPKKRNTPCPCRSGKKFKNCCLKKRNGKRF